MEKYRILTLLLVLSLISGPYYYVFSQNAPESTYRELMGKGEYGGAIKIIKGILDEIYLNRIDYRIVPGDLISLRDEKGKADLVKMFRNRKASMFFIEENEKLYQLHLDAGKCSLELKRYNEAVNHFFQSLRFTHLVEGRDDIVFYYLASSFRAQNYFKAYREALEVAYGLAPGKKEYALELADALAITPYRAKSAFYYEEYLKAHRDSADPLVYLKLANLYEVLGKYLKTQELYAAYLQKKPEDGTIHYALGVVAFKNIGNYKLAIESFERALENLADTDIFRRSKSYEFMADIHASELRFFEALQGYEKTIEFQDQMKQKIDDFKKRIDLLNSELKEMQSRFYKDRTYDEYEEYEIKRDQKGKLELDLQKLEYEFRRLNPGRVRWEMARCYERLEKREQAIDYYREAVSWDYRPNDARKKIVKLNLIIKRGY